MGRTDGHVQRHLGSDALGRGHLQRFAEAKLKRASAAQANPALQGESGDIQLDCQSSVYSESKVNSPSQTVPRLERIKRQLLQKNDWAAVRATRPARIPFAPADELARFGKRRKLTHADYYRILSGGGSVACPVSKDARQQEAPSEPETIGHLNISIRGTRAMPECQNQQRESPQKMLLDEPIDSVETSEGYNTKETSSSLLLSEDDMANLSMPYQRSFLSSRSGHLAFHRENSLGLCHPVPELPESPVIPYRSSAISSRNDHPTLSRVSSPELHHPVPQLPRRFTIDDQLSAELEGSIAPSPFNMNTDPTSGLDETTDKQSTSGWLPKSKQKIRRFMEEPRECIPAATSLSGIVGDGPSMQQCVSPVKLFGQAVNALPFQFEGVSTLQPHRFILDSHSPKLSSLNQTGSIPTGVVQEDPGSLFRSRLISKSIFPNTHRSR